MSLKPKWAGIDYGAKLAGTTVICIVYAKGNCRFHSSEKGKDADAFIEKIITEHNVEQVFLDAPLSLPGKYFEKGDSFFYRQCDVELKAMSPMFLGGLTARAMHLKEILNRSGVEVKETYPGALVRELQLEHYSKKGDLKQLKLFIQHLNMKGISFNPSDVISWHHADALLAAFSGWRFFKAEAKQVGNKAEGLILF